MNHRDVDGRRLCCVVVHDQVRRRQAVPLGQRVQDELFDPDAGVKEVGLVARDQQTRRVGGRWFVALCQIDASGGEHFDWRFIDVRLERIGDRWAVLSADSTVRVSEALQPLRGAAVQPGDLDRYAAPLSVEGFRRYSGGC